MSGFNFVGWSLTKGSRNIVVAPGGSYSPTAEEIEKAIGSGTEFTLYGVWSDNRYYTLTLKATDESTLNTNDIKVYYKHTQANNSSTVTKAWYKDIGFTTPITSIAKSELPKKQWKVIFDVFNSDAGYIEGGAGSKTADFTLLNYHLDIETEAGVVSKDISVEQDGSLKLDNFKDLINLKKKQVGLTLMVGH